MILSATMEGSQTSIDMLLNYANSLDIKTDVVDMTMISKIRCANCKYVNEDISKTHCVKCGCELNGN